VKKIKKITYSLIVSLLTLPFIVGAAEPNIPSEGSVNTIDEVYELFLQIVNYVFGFAFGVAIILIVWSGISWMTAGGDEERIGKARKNLLYGLVGIAIIIGVYTLIRIVAGLLGITDALPV